MTRIQATDHHNAGKDNEPQTGMVLVRNRNGTDSLEDSLAAYLKTKHSLSVLPSSHTFWYLPK